MSRKPGPEHHDPLAHSLPARTPGPLGHKDAADPNVSALPGDTPGTLGIQDGAFVSSTSRGLRQPLSPKHGYAPPAVRLLSSMILGATADAGQGPGKTGLFTHHTAQGKPGDKDFKEETRICKEPHDGVWRKAVTINSMSDIAKEAKDSGFKITDLGILAHGDQGGNVDLGGEVLQIESIDGFKDQFKEINANLADGGTVIIYGCVSGAGKDGTVLLKEMSKMLPNKTIVGFNVITIVKPSDPKKEGGTMFGVGGNTCYEPNMWATEAAGTSQQTVGQMWNRGNPATPAAPQAKVALNGEIKKWPSDEEKYKDHNDATRESLKVDPDILKLVKEWEPHALGQGICNKREFEYYKWKKGMVDGFNEWLRQKGIKKRMSQPK